MAIEQMNEVFDEEPRAMELYKMRNDLIMFVNKMKSEGFLASVDYEEIPLVHESEKNGW